MDPCLIEDGEGRSGVSSLASGQVPDRAHEIVVRPSTEADVPAMLAIYTYHVGRGVGDLAPDPPPPEPLQDEDIKRRRKNMLRRRLPHLVAERGGEVVGYAYAVPFRKRPAYRYAVKHSIYVRQDQLHSGIGRMLLPALIEACTVAGFRQMFAYVDGENVPSQNLHEAFGFRRVGLLQGVGYKFGHWTDSLLMQRALGPGATEPPAPQG
jgi:phosphinothricin acetyltransferase